ncbi:MAG: methyltransferase family protein [Gemmatimonadota bacterium]
MTGERSAVGEELGTEAPRWLLAWGDLMFRHRDWVFPVVLAVLFVVFPPVMAFGSDRSDNWFDLAGATVAMAGQSLRAAVVSFFSISRSGRDRVVHADELMTRGLFAASRNPLYVGNLLILLGLFMIWHSPWVYAIGGVFFLLAYRAIVASEERFLWAQFGQAYGDYVARVRRWLPEFGRMRVAGAMDGVAFRWQRIVLKEYGNIAYLAAGALLLAIADTLAVGAYRAYAARINLLVGGIVVVAVLWVGARWLKKSGRVRY